MKQEKNLYSGQLFVCTNDKAGGCASKGSLAMRDDFKKWTSQSETGLGQKIRVNMSGCLGQCERGIAVVLYPSGEWFLDVTPKDTQEIKNILSDKFNGKF